VITTGKETNIRHEEQPYVYLWGKRRKKMMFIEEWFNLYTCQHHQKLCFLPNQTSRQAEPSPVHPPLTFSTLPMYLRPSQHENFQNSSYQML